MQERDVEKGKSKGKGWTGKYAAGDGKGFRTRGAPQPATGKGKAKSKGHEQAATGNLSVFLRMQKRKRWCRHLQRVCGTKQIWEALAYTGRFDADILREALRSGDQDRDAEEDADVAAEQDQRQRLRLSHAKAEARARYNEGQRLARQRDDHRHLRRGASQLAFSSWQQKLLQRWDSGELLREMNRAVSDWGHGRLRSADGGHLDIGGSTGGGSRRIIDGWVPPDWREFLSQSDTIQDFLSHSDTA